MEKNYTPLRVDDFAKILGTDHKKIRLAVVFFVIAVLTLLIIGVAFSRLTQKQSVVLPETEEKKMSPTESVPVTETPEPTATMTPIPTEAPTATPELTQSEELPLEPSTDSAQINESP